MEHGSFVDDLPIKNAMFNSYVSWPVGGTNLHIADEIYKHDLCRDDSRWFSRIRTTRLKSHQPRFVTLNFCYPLVDIPKTIENHIEKIIGKPSINGPFSIAMWSNTIEIPCSFQLEFRILKKRYCIILLAIFVGIFPYIGLKNRPYMVGTSNQSVPEMAIDMWVLWTFLSSNYGSNFGVFFPAKPNWYDYRW